MRFQRPRWDDWNTDHIWDAHKVEQEEAEEVVFDESSRMFRVGRGRDRDQRRYVFLGQTAAGRYLAVFVHDLNHGDFYVVTARDQTDNEKRQFRRK